MADMHNFISTMEQRRTSVIHMANSAHFSVIGKNHLVIKSILECVGKQSLSFREHRDDDMFFPLIFLLSSHDMPTCRQRLLMFKYVRSLAKCVWKYSCAKLMHILSAVSNDLHCCKPRPISMYGEIIGDMERENVH